MDDSTNRAAIKRTETRITELSNEDPTNDERVIREFESLRQYLLKQEEEEEEKEDVDMDEEDDDEEEEDDDEGEDYLDELEKKLENRFVVGVIMDLLTSDEHKSAFTQDLYDNPPDGDPMLLLSTDDLSFIHKLVEKLSDSSYCLWIIISNFCEKAKEWLQWHPHSIGDDDSKITVFRDNFLDIISARDKKELNGNRGRPRARARALLPYYDNNNNNNPDTATTDFDDESEPYKEEFKLFSDSEEEKKKVPYIGKGGKKNSLTTKVGNLIIQTEND